MTQSMRVLAIDPGPKESAYVIWNGGVSIAMHLANHSLKSGLAAICQRGDTLLAVEMVACYGMPVGAETFETCLWIGRFIEAWDQSDMPEPARLVYRKDVKMHLCGSMRAKDGNIRQALIDKHGPVGTKKNPGRLYGISGHLWAALAVADYVAHQLQSEKANL